MKILFLTLLASALVLGACPRGLAASGESQFGNIRLTVTDPLNAAVPGATATCENKSTGAASVCLTDDDGFCLFTKLEPGLSYSITVTATGFKTAIRSDIPVQASRSTSVTTQLEVGSADGTITITSDPPGIDTETTTLSTSVSGQQLENLPMNGRRFSEFSLLAPGVTSNTVSQDGVNLTVNGSRARSNNFVIDGVDKDTASAQQSEVLAVPAAGLPVEAVQELRIARNFSADLGRGTGAVIDLTIKSGTNDLHGSAFEYLRNTSLTARDFFNSIGPKNKLNYNDFGFTIGGPFKRDRAFWFVAYEGRRERKDRTSIAAVPTESDFAQAIIGLGGNPAIPLAQNPAVNPIIRNLFALCRAAGQCPGGISLWPAVNRPGQVLNAFSPSHSSTDSNAFVVKPSIILNARNHLSGHILLVNSDKRLPLALGGGGDLPRTNTFVPDRSRTAMVSHAITLSPYVINEARLSWDRHRTEFLDEDKLGVRNPAQTIELNTGVTNSNDFGLPQILVRGFEPLGASPFSNPRRLVSTSWQFVDRLTLVHSSHSIDAGYEFRRMTIDSFNDVNFRGNLEFNSLTDFLAGNITRGSILRGDSNRTTVQNSHAIFFHDTYRVVQQFTLNFGLRWDILDVLYERNGLFSRYDPSRGLVVPESLYQSQLTNLNSRLGFAWSDRDGKTVLRAGAGIYFDPFPQDYFVGQVQFNTFNAGVAYNPLPERPILTSRSPRPLLQPGQPVFPESSFVPDSRDVSTVEKISTPYVYNYNIGMQRELFAETVLEVAYVGSAGRKLFRTRNLNAPIVLGGPHPFDGSAVLSSVAPNKPFVVNQIETSANSNYNSLQVSLRQRSWHGFTNSAAWTWSHSIDDASDGIDLVPNKASPDNPHSPRAERASSNFDTRHRLTWAFMYDVPEKVAKLRLGKGWQISGILNIHSGQPYHVNFGSEFDSVGAYNFILRPDLVGDPHLGTAVPDRLLNLAALRVPCVLDGLGTDVSNCLPGTLHYGNLPRNAFVGPGFKNLDFSISKNTSLTESLKLQFRADFFTLTNHPNFASPLAPRFIARASLKGIDAVGRGGARGVACNTALASNDCYLPSTRTANAPRTIQVSMKLLF